MRRKRLIDIALRKPIPKKTSIFIDNLPVTIMANEFTQGLAIIANVELLKCLEKSKKVTEALRYTK